MTENTKFFRNARIWGKGDVLEAIAAIPGYTVEPAPLIQEGRTHALRTPDGDLIHLVSDGRDPHVVKTSNIEKQDRLDAPVPFQLDELVKLANAAAVVNEARKKADPDAEDFLGVTVSVSEHDLATLS